MKKIQISNRTSFQSPKGNVLFIILIAVALFAALSYAVSSGMRGGESTITSQQAKVGAGEILRSMSSIREGYAYLVNQGCSIDDIEFDNPATTNLSCQIFHVQGAGVSYMNNLEQYQTTTGVSINFSNVAISDVGTSTSERIAMISDLQEDICNSLNAQLGHDFTEVPVVDTPPLGSTTTDLAGKHAFCIRNSGGATLRLIFTLLEL